MISIGNIITDNTWKVINAKQGKSRTENGALRNTSINRALLKALPIQERANLFTTEKSRSKSENMTENCIGFIFQEEQYAKPCQKPLTYQMLQLEQNQTYWKA